jgi:hypothetical protein
VKPEEKLTLSKAIRMLIPALAVPVAAQAQNRDRIADLNYRAALSKKMYSGTSGMRSSPFHAGAEVAARVALAKCQEGDTAFAIPVLERKPTNAKVERPAH